MTSQSTFPQAERITLTPASITAIAYRPHGPSVLTVNSVSGDLGWLGGKP